MKLVDCFKFEILYSILFLVRNGILGIWGELTNPQIRLLSDPTSVVLWGIFSFIFIGEDLDTVFSTSAAEWPVQGTYGSQSHLSETSAGRGLWRTHASSPRFQMGFHWEQFLDPLQSCHCSLSWSLNPSEGGPVTSKSSYFQVFPDMRTVPSLWFFMGLFSSRRECEIKTSWD